MPIDLNGLVVPGGALDEQLGIEAPEFDPTQEPAYRSRPFLESLGALQGMPQVQPRNFGEGLLGGLSRGLGYAGTKAQQERMKFETLSAERQKRRDEANLQASRDYRTARLAAGKDVAKESRTAAARKLEDETKATADAAKYERDNPEPGTPAYRIMIQRHKDLAAAGRGPKDASNEPLMAIEGPNGPVYVTRSQALGKSPAKTTRTNQPVKGADRQALAYYNRGKGALETITAPDAQGGSLEKRVAANIGGQVGLQYAPNFLQSPEQRAYRQAQRAFTEARLRKESGAAIPPHEYEADAKTYFVQPGDTPDTIEQKRLSREVVLEGLAYGAGPAFEEFYGEPFKPSASIQVPATGTTASRVPFNPASAWEPD